MLWFLADFLLWNWGQLVSTALLRWDQNGFSGRGHSTLRERAPPCLCARCQQGDGCHDYRLVTRWSDQIINIHSEINKKMMWLFCECVISCESVIIFSVYYKLWLVFYWDVLEKVKERLAGPKYSFIDSVVRYLHPVFRNLQDLVKDRVFIVCSTLDITDTRFTGYKCTWVAITSPAGELSRIGLGQPRWPALERNTELFSMGKNLPVNGS